MNKTRLTVQLLSLFVCAFCVVYLGKYIYDGYTEKKNMSQLQSIVSMSETEDGEKKNKNFAPNGMLAMYYDLYQKNNDMVGWIKIEGTDINYPVMYRNDSNDYYMNRNFEKQEQRSGIPFMDMECNLSQRSDNIIIYAHNMRNGTMFAPLLKYADKDFLNEHRIINFDTLYKRNKYKVISVFRTQVGSAHEFKYYNFIDASSEEDFENFVDGAKKLSLHDIEDKAVYGDYLLTLSTCSYNSKNERFVVIAKKIN